jgi:3,4-dihydroxy-2-butanone 4-phosphate synthase
VVDHLNRRRRGRRGLDRRPAEAAVELARIGGVTAAVGMSALVSTVRPISMATGAELHEFATRHALTVVTLGDVHIEVQRRLTPISAVAAS